MLLALPKPDGTTERFDVVEARVMEPELAAEFPDIKTFRGIGVDDPTASLRFDCTPLGFHAQVLSVNGSYYIDPYELNDADGTYVSYYKQDVPCTDSAIAKDRSAVPLVDAWPIFVCSTANRCTTRDNCSTPSRWLLHPLATEVEFSTD